MQAILPETLHHRLSEAMLRHGYRVAARSLLKCPDQSYNNHFMTCLQASTMEEMKAACRREFDSAVAWREEGRLAGHHRLFVVAVEACSDEAQQRMSRLHQHLWTQDTQQRFRLHKNDCLCHLQPSKAPWL